jgi:PAS domain S-box-containing protein
MISPVLFWAPPVVIGTVVGGLAVYVWRCRPAVSAATLSAALAGIALWCISYGMELRAPTSAQKILWVRLELPGVTTVAVLCLLLALEYTGRPVRRRTAAVLFLVPLLTQASNWTDGAFHWYWRRVWLDHGGPIPLLGRQYGPGFWLHVVYSYSVLALAAARLILFLRRGNQAQAKQTVVFLGSALLPASVGLVYIFDLSPLTFLDCTPFAFALTGAGMTWVLFRYRFQAIVPVAWKTVVESMPESVLVLDLQGRVAGVNHAAEMLLGRKQAVCIGYPPAVVFQARPELIPICSGDSSGQWDLTISAQGTDRIFEVEVLPVCERGRTRVGRLLKIRDVTSHRQAARELAASKERAEAATVAKSQFLANMSHEIRTPMNGILGMSRLLVEQQLTAEAAEYAADIHASARSLLAILNDILDFAKIEAGKLELEHVAFDLRQSLAEATRLMDWAAREKGIRLIFRYADEAPSRVIGDPVRLRQVVVNLLSNGIKFTPAGEVSLSVECKERHEGSAEFLVSVRDTGIGIPQDKLPVLFQHFTQADATVTRKFGGTGLGLAISRQLVEKMGGVIRAQSHEAQGSDFTVDVRLALDRRANVQRAPESGEGAPPVRDFKGSRILLAEDNPVNQRLGQHLLEGLGCTVDIAANGAEAVRRTVDTDYQLIFMDCQMPEVDGFEAAARIRARGTETPIIALTASALEETRRACLQVGMNDYMTKPVDPDLWRETLKRWL